MRNECHKLAEHILRYPAKTSAEKWLRREMVELLTKRSNIAGFTNDYAMFLEEEEVLNPYLRELTKSYEESF